MRRCGVAIHGWDLLDVAARWVDGGMVRER